MTLNLVTKRMTSPKYLGKPYFLCSVSLSMLIDNSNEDSECSNIHTDQLMLLSSQHMIQSVIFYARGCSISIHKPQWQASKTKSFKVKGTFADFFLPICWFRISAGPRIRETLFSKE